MDFPTFSLVYIAYWPSAIHLQEVWLHLPCVSFHQEAAESNWLSDFLGSFFLELCGQICVYSRTLTIWNLPEIRYNRVGCMTIQVIKGICCICWNHGHLPISSHCMADRLVSVCPWTQSWKILKLVFISSPAGHAMKYGSITPGAAPPIPLHLLPFKTGEPEPKWYC